MSLSDTHSKLPVPHPVATFKQAFDHYSKDQLMSVYCMNRSHAKCPAGEILEICVSNFNKPTPIQVSVRVVIFCALHVGCLRQ